MPSPRCTYQPLKCCCQAPPASCRCPPAALAPAAQPSFQQFANLCTTLSLCTIAAAGVADLLQQAAADGGATSTVTVVSSPPSGPPAPDGASGGSSPTPTGVTPGAGTTPGGSSGGGGLNAGAILGGGFAPSPSPPPLMPPFPPGQVALDPSKIDNTMQVRGNLCTSLQREGFMP